MPQEAGLLTPLNSNSVGNAPQRKGGTAMAAVSLFKRW